MDILNVEEITLQKLRVILHLGIVAFLWLLEAGPEYSLQKEEGKNLVDVWV